MIRREFLKYVAAMPGLAFLKPSDADEIIEMREQPESEEKLSPPYGLQDIMVLHVENRYPWLEGARVESFQGHVDKLGLWPSVTMDVLPVALHTASTKDMKEIARTFPIDGKQCLFRISTHHSVGWDERRLDGVLESVEADDSGMWRLNIVDAIPLECIQYSK